ncbi:MAG: glutamate 5-kinase [Alphaproteobacteria bacterium]|nr:glutamate 5-kinase [Alphaproteobacteria bacterium]
MNGGKLSSFKRIVVKVGSALLVDAANGQVRADWLASLADDLAQLKKAGVEVLVVSSGAIALGRQLLKLPSGPLKLEESQAAAAVGQIELGPAWNRVLASHGYQTGQILLTLSDTEERRRYLNARSTLDTLLRLGAIPIINENDTVATSEIRYGDNDRLAARVASMASADCLVLLSDIDGLYTAPPGPGSSAEHIPIVHTITPAIEAMAGSAGSELSRGGMKTKIEAGKIATHAGAQMVIASGKTLHPLASIDRQDTRKTWFSAATNPTAARKSWIAGSLEPKGSITVDAGAVAALQRGKSLLPAGVTAVSGQFQRGDCVWITGPGGVHLARGLITYDSDDAGRLIGCHSKDIEARLGYAGRDTMIHRDNMAMVVAGTDERMPDAQSVKN